MLLLGQSSYILKECALLLETKVFFIEYLASKF